MDNGEAIQQGANLSHVSSVDLNSCHARALENLETRSFPPKFIDALFSIVISAINYNVKGVIPKGGA